MSMFAKGGRPIGLHLRQQILECAKLRAVGDHTIDSEDHGNNAAVTTATRSTLKVRSAGSRHAAKIDAALSVHDALRFSFTKASDLALAARSTRCV